MSLATSIIIGLAGDGEALVRNQFSNYDDLYFICPEMKEEYIKIRTPYLY